MPHEPKPLPSRLLFIADASHADDVVDLVRAAVSAGVSFVEVRRERRPDGLPESRRRLDELRRCLAAAPGATVIVNDRVDLALLAGAHGAHVGQEDLPVEAARLLLGSERLLGLSTHDEAQAAAAAGLPLDYVAVGPIFPSATKSGHAEPLGLERLMACCEAAGRPVVAIGGIDAGNVLGVLDAGAAAACVAGAIARGDVVRQAREILSVVEGHRPLARAASGAEPIVLAGLPGSGKTTVGRLLASRLGVPFLDLDEAVGGDEGIASVAARLGDEALRTREAAALAELLAAAPARRVISLGGGTTRGARSRVLLRRSGAIMIRLDVPAAECLRRLAAAPPRPLLAAAEAAGPAAVHEHLAVRQASLWGFACDASGRPDEVVARILAALAPGSDAGVPPGEPQGGGRAAG